MIFGTTFCKECGAEMQEGEICDRTEWVFITYYCPDCERTVKAQIEKPKRTV